jgi:hypothetical protein
MKLIITFKNFRGEIMDFSWELFDKRHSYAWVDLMKEWKTKWRDGIPEFKDKWFISSTNEDFLNYIKQIKIHVDRIDSIGQHYVGSENINEDITREELNRIHEEFHKYVETCEKDSPNRDIRETEELCHKLNDLVHLTEISEKNRHQIRPDKRIIATAVPHMQVDYDESDYDNFTCTMCRGWIYVGYATPGKNLFHCFCDDDMSVVEKGLVRQSQGLSNELHIELDGEENIVSEYEYGIKEKYYKWCVDNKIEDYGYNFRNSKYNPGRIPLAKPIGDIDDLVYFFGLKQGEIIDLNFE